MPDLIVRCSLPRGGLLACAIGMPGSASRTDLLPATLRLGRVAGIPLGLHFSWFIIAGLITVSLAGQFREAHAAWSLATIWSVAAVTAMLFFITLLAHELSHAFVARARGLPVRSITLFALGGVAQIEHEAATRQNVNELPVVRDGQLQGVVTRSQILQVLQARSELRAKAA